MPGDSPSQPGQFRIQLRSFGSGGTNPMIVCGCCHIARGVKQLGHRNKPGETLARKVAHLVLGASDRSSAHGWLIRSSSSRRGQPTRS
jgi:hypothetical protein